MSTGLNPSDIPATENGLALLSANEVHIRSGDFWFHFRKNGTDGFSGWTGASAAVTTINGGSTRQKQNISPLLLPHEIDAKGSEDL